jgi:PBP1b-binding outer membrane lipoprotein LpoB
MKIVMIIMAALILTGCGGEKSASHADAALQKQMDMAKLSLQQKADEMARKASMSPPPAQKQ